tara:strand:+ start:2204 stop:2392 length:189 start_codon:yes stop_codon:yes gene_type:complete
LLAGARFEKPKVPRLAFVSPLPQEPDLGLAIDRPAVGLSRAAELGPAPLDAAATPGSVGSAG